jgi:S1-C subfamily serine protease
VLVALVAGALVVRSRPDRAGVSPAEVVATAQAVVAAAFEEARAAPSDAAQAYQILLPSLVLIEAVPPGAPAPAATSAPGTVPSGTGPGGPPAASPTPGAAREALGAGVIVSEQGAILTALHVVADAAAIRARFADGTEANAEIVARDAAADIAVLATDRPPGIIVPAVLGGGASIGDEVYAIGHPLGLGNSISAGVVSGLDRTVPIDDELTLEGLIQFDAAVNPGNSGGPLVNRDGQVIGIVTALANPSRQGYFIGIGFAVPIGTASGAAGGPSQ